MIKFVGDVNKEMGIWQGQEDLAKNPRQEPARWVAELLGFVLVWEASLVVADVGSTKASVAGTG